MKLKVKRIHADARLPGYGHKGDAGMDLYSVAEMVLEPAQAIPVPTGIQLEIPEHHVGLIWAKSGISLSGVHRLAGVVDAGYRGEVKVVMINLGRESFKIEKGMKIAQILIQPVLEIEVLETTELDSTSRGDGGFGSTGRF